jgi:hypothetical protein
VRAALALLVVAAGCGDNARPAGDRPDAGAIACTATFHGNFEERSTSRDDCGALDAGALRFDLPIRALDTSLEVTIDLGAAPTAGAYAPPTVSTWSATAFQRIGNGGCLYSAGADAVPQGSFELTLDTIDPPHGALRITQSVLVFPGTDCGDVDTETVELAF